MKRRLAMLTPLLLIGAGSGGCAIHGYYSNIVVLEDDLHQFRSAYIVLKSHIVKQRAIFSTEDWNSLVDVHNQLLLAQGVINGLRATGSFDEKFLSAEELTTMAKPLLVACRNIKSVFDRNLDKLTPESRDAYTGVSQLFSQIDANIDELIADPAVLKSTQTLSKFLQAGNKMMEAIKIVAVVL